MIVLDANILIYAFSETSPYREASATWLEEALERREELALPWLTILAFLRITTGPAYERNSSLATAVARIGELLEQSNVRVMEALPGHWRAFSELLEASQATRNLINDAHLAALALAHGAALCTNDRDFTRFAGLKIVNPVARV